MKKKIIIVVTAKSADKAEEIINALTQDTKDYTAHDAVVYVDDVIDVR